MLAVSAILIIVFLKFAIPLGIIIMPFGFGWANFVLDSIDGDLLIPLGLTDEAYQPIDKLADLATYIAMAVAAWHLRWKIRKWIYALFGLRFVGQLLFFISGDERVFFFFPNFLEVLFLLYATLVFFKKEEAYDFYKKYRIFIWAFIVVYKLQDEWVTHIGNIDRTDFLLQLFT